MPSQYRILWSTAGGGTGYTVLHFTTAGTDEAAQGIADDVRVFAAGIAAGIPDETSLELDTEVLDLTEAGDLIAVHAVDGGPAIPGVYTGAYSRAQGLRLDWGTGNIVSGRRLRGRTYVVPIASNSFTSDGLLSAGAIDAFKAIGQGLIDASSVNRPLRVWSRTHATSWAVETVDVPAKGAILRGRRD